MTIALILPVPPGYSETFFKSKIRGLQDNGYKVILVTAATKDRFKDCKHVVHPKVYKSLIKQSLAMLIVGLGLLPHIKQVIRYVRLERKNKTTLKRIIEKVYINATLLKLKADWLHFGFATMAIQRELVAKAIKAKMAVSFRGYDINVYPLKNKEVYKLLWKNVDKVHSISNDLLQRAYALGLSETKNYQIITPAVNIKNLPVLRERELSAPLKMVTIARLHYIKGVDLLLETAHILNQRGVNFIWEIIGGGQAQDEERYLYQCYKLGLKNKVKFKGKLDHKETLDVLGQTDLYIQTSLIEGFCNAVLESQSLGKISIAFDTGGLKENIKDGETGFLVKPNDTVAMANMIEYVIGLSEAEKQKMQQLAIRRVKQQFNIEQQQQAFVAFFTA
ncbi:glycosyltransferase family 4 protein [Aestuariibaculum suncheonense]|uniref:Glycosyltransferase family 4 protein n=2 Tax=Aestuariibaculum suncheonense TaxID=1028745 RepID=A0A8J6QBI2_9FLAO|nr:glycosyltransferase family 4 protein [Aestuariibaculum suncheonense]